jgi:hypothetical protein
MLQMHSIFRFAKLEIWEMYAASMIAFSPSETKNVAREFLSDFKNS